MELNKPRLNKWLREVHEVEVAKAIKLLEKDGTYFRVKYVKRLDDKLEMVILVSRKDHKIIKSNTIEGRAVRDYLRAEVLRDANMQLKSMGITINLYVASAFRKRTLLFAGELNHNTFEYMNYETK